MPTITCPACGRRIDLPDAELSLPSIQCARCDNHFCPATGQLLDETAVAVLDGTGYEPTVPTPERAAESAPGLQPGTKAALFVLVGVLALFGVLLTVALSSSRKKDQPAAKAKTPSESSAEQGKPGGPEDYAPSGGTDYVLGVWGWVCLIWALILFLSLAILAWVAGDIRARAPDQAPLWCLVILVGNLLGLLLWLGARPPLPRPPV